MTDENVRSDLQQIANAAGYALTIIGWTPPDEAPTKPQTPDAHRRYSSGSMQAVRPGGLAARVDAILEEGKEPKT